MKIAIISHKGGAGKTTTAVHLAAYLQTLGPCLLLDGDETKNAIAGNQRGPGYPFRVELMENGGPLLAQFEHVVIDTGQRPDMDDQRAAYALCDVIVIPSAPASYDIDGLGQTIRALRGIGPDKFTVLLAKVARDAAKEAAELRGLLAGMKAPVLTAEIPYLKAFTKAAAAGQIVSATDDKNAGRAWEAYAAAGKELTAWAN